MSIRRRASSLLIILLIMTGVSSIVLVGSRALIDSSRLAAVSSSLNVAQQIAQAGVQDGLALYTKGLLKDGEYGAGFFTDMPVGVNYSISEERRTFTDSACTVWGVDKQFTLAQPDCPFYDMAIRTIIARTQPESLVPVSNALTTRELPNGIAVTIPVKKTTGGLSVTFNPALPGMGANFSYDYDYCTGGYACESGVVTGGTGLTNLQLDIANPNIKALRVTAHYPGLTSGPHVPIITSFDPLNKNYGVSPILNQIAVGKGYTTINVIGYAGGVRKAQLVTIRTNDRRSLSDPIVPGPTYTLVDLVGEFSNEGLRIP